MTEREETILVIYGMKYDGCDPEEIANGLTTSSEFVKTVDARLVE